jgi:1H-pyrrole-2-carbonyl-[peptidyl-carrier protein] chlorinase
MKTDFDVAIIGGGPAGASLGAYLGQAGLSTVILEKELFPRPHVGESFVPSSTRVFRDIGFLQTMEDYRFPHKYGAIWTTDINKRTHQVDWEGLSPEDFAGVRFDERDQPGVDQRYTYHVDRGLFDLLLLQHSELRGSHVVEGVAVIDADFSDPEVVRVGFAAGPKKMELTTKLLVDASGRDTFVAKRRRWRVHDSVFNQYAIYAWFGGYDRDAVVPRPPKGEPLDNPGFIHFLPITNTWVWQIPVNDEVTSIGVVTEKQRFKGSRQSREGYFWDAVGSRPDLHDALRAADQVRPFKHEADYSYAIRQLADDRLLLIGDAARFVDPIFSTGVSIALNSARFAQRDILKAFETGDFSRRSFADYEAIMKRGHRNWYEFIGVYYRLNVLFTAFINDPRYRLDVLKLLQGDVYDADEPPALRRMKEIVSHVEKNPDHVWHDVLGSLTADVFANALN